MRGEILTVDGTGGLIAGSDGNRYRFEPADYRRDAPRPGLGVDFVPDGEAARDVYPLTSAVLAGIGAQSASAAAAGSGNGPWAQPGAPGQAGPPPATVAGATSWGAAGASFGSGATSFAAAAPPPPRNRGLLAYFFRATTDNYANFHGRARRKEYWGFALFYLVCLVLLMGLTGIGVATSHFGTVAAELYISPALYIGSTLVFCFLLGMIVPSLAVAVRRLHDIGCSGWWLLLHFVPGVGNLALIVMSVIDSVPGPNRFGPPEK